MSAREVENCLNRHVIKEFPKLAKRKATDITPHDVVEIIAKMIRAGLTRKANMVRAYLHAAFAVAAKSDLNPRVSGKIGRHSDWNRIQCGTFPGKPTSTALWIAC